MRIQELVIILRIHHVVRYNHHIRIMHSLNALQVLEERGNIRIVNIIVRAVFREKDTQLTPLGVDVIVPSCSQVFHKRTRFTAGIDLDLVDPLLLIFEIGKSITRYLPRNENAPMVRYD